MMSAGPIQIITLKEKPDLETQIDRISGEAWPEFLRHSKNPYWRVLFSTFAEFQLLLCDPPDTVVAVGHTIPFVWDGRPQDLPSGIEMVMERAVRDLEQRRAATTLSALAAMVSREHRNKGLSEKLLGAMTSLAAEHGLRELIAPVRPTWKSLYPLAPLGRYIQWKREDGSPFDPWLRVHWRLGAQQLQIVPEAMTINGTVSEWKEWTGMRFPESGDYVVPGALQPVTIDRERNVGHYHDPNVWLRHPIAR